MTVASAKELDINQLLANLGFMPTRRTPKDTWYLRPYGQESHASFHVSKDGRAWFDFGTGKGGSIIELAMLLAGVDNVAGALAYLAQYGHNQPGRHLAKSSLAPAQHLTQVPAYQVLGQGPLSDPRGLALLVSRALDPPALEPYLRQVHFRWQAGAAEYYGLGLLNGAGGYELRTTRDGVHWRKTSLGPKAISVFGASQPAAPWLLFEGWPDFGSFLSEDKPPVGAFNFLILNGTGLVGQATAYLATQPVGSLVVCSQAGEGAARTKQALLNWAKAQGWSAGDMDQRWAGYQDYNHKRMQQMIGGTTAPESRLKTPPNTHF